MQNGLKAKYNLPTAIAMVVGIVIGSGVFFKGEKVLNLTGGNLPLGILAWVLGAVIMIVCAYTFSIMATRHIKVNGVVDYAEAMVGNRYAYTIGWFTTFIYFPSMTAVLAWVSARYLGVLLGWDITGGSVMLLAAFFLILSFFINTISPIIAGKIQVSTTVIKLIPLILMAIIGTVVGLVNGTTVENFSNIVTEVSGGNRTALFSALCATAFAYEGWIIATSINAEIKNAKKNLPKALIIGTLIVACVYIFYYIGIAGAASNSEIMNGGEEGVKLAFSNIFGPAGGTILMILLVISCLGTLNGLMLASTRGLYSISARNCGPKPQIFNELNQHTNMPTNSGIVAMVICAAWLVYFFGANLAPTSWFGPVTFDSSELPIITLYAFYIPIFLFMTVKEKDLPPFKRFVMPVLSIIGCLFMIVASVFSHGFAVVWYIIVFAVIMLAALPFYRKQID